MLGATCPLTSKKASLLCGSTDRKQDEYRMSFVVVLFSLTFPSISNICFCPFQNVNGKIIEFNFEPKIEHVISIGLLDFDYKTTFYVKHMNPYGQIRTTTILVPQLGDNSYQVSP
jgi:hypothetical protein